MTTPNTPSPRTPLLRDSLRGLQSPWIALYAITLAAHLISAAMRLVLATIALWLTRLLTGWPIPTETLALIAAFAPLAISLLSVICPPLIAPLDGRWWEISAGGRQPEQDEREAFEQAIDELQQADPTIKAPRHWFVAEEPGPNASAYASSLSVNRGLLESPYAPAVIAHELGHLKSSDARLTSALNLLIIHQTPKPQTHPLTTLPLRAALWIASGNAVMQALGNAWEMYWRSRELAADQYAADLGQAAGLAHTLEHDSLPYERAIKHMRFSRATHPYTKPRITRLREHTTNTEHTQ